MTMKLATPPTPAERPIPFDANAESATVGSMLLDRDAVIAVAPWLRPAHFFVERHAWVYEAILACYNRRTPPDLISVSDELRRQGRLDAIGGPAALVELTNSAPASVHVEYYGRIVQRTAIMRGLIQAGGRIAQLGYREDMEPEDALSKAEEQIFAIAQQRDGEGAVAIDAVANTFFERMTAAANGEAQVGVPTGYRDLDDLLLGLQPEAMITLAARTGVGKTALANCIAVNAAQRGSKVLLFTLEVGRDEVLARMLSTLTGIDSQKLKTGEALRESEMQTVMDGLGILSSLPIMIDDTPGLSITDVRSRARREYAMRGVDLIIIDYLQLLSGVKSDNREQEVSSVSRGIKSLARELRVPVLTLAQLSRAVEKRQSNVPVLSDLRESGSIEMDSDVVMFIYREELYDPDTDKKGIAEIHVAKHRSGPTGVVPLRFFTNTTRFGDLERWRAPEGY